MEKTLLLVNELSELSLISSFYGEKILKFVHAQIWFFAIFAF